MSDFTWYAFNNEIGSLKEVKSYSFTKLLRRSILGYVYVILLSNNRIKVGSTSDVYNRISSLQSEYVNYRNLQMIGAYVSIAHNTYLDTEKHMHTILKRFRIKGSEEFQLPKDISTKTIRIWLETLFETFDNLKMSSLEIYNLALNELEQWVSVANMRDMCKNRKFSEIDFPKIDGCEISSIVIPIDYPEPLALYTDGFTRNKAGFIKLTRNWQTITIKELEKLLDTIPD